jgi:hypothetical protein
MESPYIPPTEITRVDGDRSDMSHGFETIHQCMFDERDDDNEEWFEEIAPPSYDPDKSHTGPLESAEQSPDE